MLTGYGGAEPADLDALVELALRLSRLADELPEVVDCALDPVVATPSGAWVLERTGPDRAADRAGRPAGPAVARAVAGAAFALSAAMGPNPRPAQSAEFGPHPPVRSELGIEQLSEFGEAIPAIEGDRRLAGLTPQHGRRRHRPQICFAARRIAAPAPAPRQAGSVAIERSCQPVAAGSQGHGSGKIRQALAKTRSSPAWLNAPRCTTSASVVAGQRGIHGIVRPQHRSAQFTTELARDHLDGPLRHRPSVSSSAGRQLRMTLRGRRLGAIVRAGKTECRTPTRPDFLAESAAIRPDSPPVAVVDWSRSDTNPDPRFHIGDQLVPHFPQETQHD